MTEETKKTTEKPKKSELSTMNIVLINSKGEKLTIDGFCSDREFKAICKAIDHTENQNMTWNKKN